MNLAMPEQALVVLIGPSGAGKSTFARRHFRGTEIVSSDFCRGLVADDENDQSATTAAFDVLHYIAAKRLSAGRLTVIDATNVQEEARTPLLALARQYYVPAVAIVFNLPEALCHERNSHRPDRDFGPHVVRRQIQQLRRSLRGLQREGFRQVFIFRTAEEAVAATVERERLWNDLRHEHGPFDIVGDIHGCCDELETLLEQLGYEEGAIAGAPLWGERLYAHPGGRKAIFLGDLIDRGPRILDTVRLVHNMVLSGSALCIPGNHEQKLLRKLAGRNVQVSHGLERTLAEIDALSGSERDQFSKEIATFLDSLIGHYVLDEGRLVVAHAGLKEAMQGRAARAVREFALYGETTGETDEFGLPVRYNWAADYRGTATVVYGHTPVPEPEWLNQTINIDTGCVFGGALTALRYPERELVSVPAAAVYYQPSRPFPSVGERAASLTVQQQHDDLLDIDDVIGRRIITSRLHRTVAVREENAIAALEVMSRFAVNPKWLIYLPPTMSPCGTSREPGLLEHPAQAFAYYRDAGVPRVVCQEKHMGSRAVVIVCRDEDAARRRFGVVDEGSGICYTRTGRRFFEDRDMEVELLGRLRAALEHANVWKDFQTDWLCLDCELMPWSAKAQDLLRQQYAPTGAAARAGLVDAVSALDQATQRGASVEALAERFRGRLQMAEDYVQAYRRYCWPVHSLADLKLAPFHLLATEEKVHIDKDHCWHMETLAGICRQDEQLLQPTQFKIADVTDAASEAEAASWWEELTARGGEGMVVKPFDFFARGPRGLAQPAVKCRGREYLRIIYGPEYTAPEHLDRLRSRGLAAKRALALREFALGIESLERFVRREPLRRVHECAFAVLALESEPVDPRL